MRGPLAHPSKYISDAACSPDRYFDKSLNGTSFGTSLNLPHFGSLNFQVVCELQEKPTISVSNACSGDGLTECGGFRYTQGYLRQKEESGAGSESNAW